MFLYQATVAGGAEFTGATAALGLLDFNTQYAFETQGDIAIAPVVYTYGYDGGVTVADLTVVFLEPAGAATERIVLINETGITDHMRNCGRDGLAVPRTAGVVWDMVFTTANKNADASIVVAWGIGEFP